MPKENQATVFIRLLTQAYEAHLEQRSANLSVQHKISADKFKQRQMSALKQFMHAMEPLDSVHLMAPKERSLELSARRPAGPVTRAVRLNSAYFH